MTAGEGSWTTLTEMFFAQARKLGNRPFLWRSSEGHGIGAFRFIPDAGSVIHGQTFTMAGFSRSASTGRSLCSAGH